MKNVKSLFTEKWYPIGLELLEPKHEHDLGLIKANKNKNVSDYCEDMLELWLEKQRNATWSQLIEALKSDGVEMLHVASEIEEMLTGKLSKSGYYSSKSWKIYWLLILLQLMKYNNICTSK